MRSNTKVEPYYGMDESELKVGARLAHIMSGHVKRIVIAIDGDDVWLAIDNRNRDTAYRCRRDDVLRCFRVRGDV